MSLDRATAFGDLLFLSMHIDEIGRSPALRGKLQSHLRVPTTTSGLFLASKCTLITALGLQFADPAKFFPLDPGRPCVAVQPSEADRFHPRLEDIAKIELLLCLLGCSVPSEGAEPSFFDAQLPSLAELSEQCIGACERLLQELKKREETKYVLKVLSHCHLPNAVSKGEFVRANLACSSDVSIAHGVLPCVSVPSQATKLARLLGIALKPTLNCALRALDHLVATRCSDISRFTPWLNYVRSHKADIEIAKGLEKPAAAADHGKKGPGSGKGKGSAKSAKGAGVESLETPGTSSESESEILQWLAEIAERPFFGAYIGSESKEQSFHFLTSQQVYCPRSDDKSTSTRSNLEVTHIVSRLLRKAVLEYSNLNHMLAPFADFFVDILGCRRGPDLGDALLAIVALYASPTSRMNEGHSDILTEEARKELFVLYMFVESFLQSEDAAERWGLLYSALPSQQQIAMFVPERSLSPMQASLLSRGATAGLGDTDTTRVDLCPVFPILLANSTMRFGLSRGEYCLCDVMEVAESISHTSAFADLHMVDAKLCRSCPRLIATLRVPNVSDRAVAFFRCACSVPEDA